MSPKHSPSAAPVAVGILLSSLLLAGCATEKALTQQTQPLHDQIVRLEQALATTGESATRSTREQTERIAARQAELEKQLGELRAEFRAQENRLGAMDERARRTGQRVDDIARQTAVRAEALTARQDGDATALKALTERVAQAERRLDDATGLSREAATRAAALDEKRVSDAAAVAALAERVRQAEPRVDAAAAEAREAARQTRALAARQDGDAAASAALNERLAQAEQRLKVLSEQVQEALALAAKEIFLAVGREAFTVTLTEDKVLYPLNDPNLDRRDVAKLDDLVRRLGELDQEYHLDIQGHTDNTSTDDNNYNLGKARAEVAKRHLSESKGISVSRMSTVSYGANKPLDPAGRHNRRIHIRVLVLK